MLRERPIESRANKNLMITKTIVAVLFSIFAVVTVLTDISRAADKGSVDVVLVIDSSGSMKKTDPLSLRIPAAKLFISLLDKDDRAGVVSFSGTSKPLISLTPVDNELNKKKLFEAADKITSDGLLTNLHDALNTGLEILSKDKGTERSKIIVLMSDGMMDVGNPDEDRRLADRSKTNLAVALKDNGIKVFTIAFTRQSDIRLLEKISKRTEGFHNLALEDSEFHLIFTSIFESLKTPEMLPMSSNGFLVDKSVEEVTIVATKDAPDVTIQIDSAEGQSHTYKNKGAGIKWFVSNSFDMITIKDPSHGRWEILFSAGENNKAYIISNLRLQSDFNQMHATFGKPVNVKMWLEKEGVTIKEKDILDKIDMYIELSTPDGKTLKLKPYPTGKGIFTRKVASFTVGDYRLKLVAKGMTFERQKSFVFNVASVKEAKEEIKFKETEKKILEEMHSEDNEHPEDNEHQADKEVNETDETSWVSFFVQFFILNLIVGIGCFLYFKRKNLKNFTNLKAMLSPGKLLSLIKGKKKEEIQEEQESEAAPEEAEPQQEAEEENVQEIQEIQEKQESEAAPEEAEPQQEAAEEAAQESQEEQENEAAPEEAEPQQEAAEEAAPESQEEQESEAAPEEAEPQQEAAEEVVQESQEEAKNEIALDEVETGEEAKNEIALDEVETGEEATEAAAPESQEEQESEAASEEAEPQQEAKEAAAPESQEEQKIEAVPEQAEPQQEAKEEPGSA